MFLVEPGTELTTRTSRHCVFLGQVLRDPICMIDLLPPPKEVMDRMHGQVPGPTRGSREKRKHIIKKGQKKLPHMYYPSTRESTPSNIGKGITNKEQDAAIVLVGSIKNDTPPHIPGALVFLAWFA